MNNPIIIQIGGVFLILFFLVALVLSAKTWRIWHVLISFGVFAAALTFLAFASMSLKTRATWRSAYNQESKALDQAQAEAVQLLQGDLTEVRQTEESLRSARGKLNRAVLDRGRVWRQCTPTNIAGGTITLSTKPPEVDQAPPNGLAAQTILYAFLETPTPDGLSKVPFIYLGKYLASAVTDDSVTLTPLLPLGQNPWFWTNEISASLQQAGATWALYEVVPPDGHRIFSTDPTGTADLRQEGEPLFGPMDEQTLRQLISNRFKLPAEQYEALISTYVRDGSRANDNDPPENRWLKVQFKKPHQVRVDSAVAQSALGGDFFDANGMAQVDYLRRPDGEPAEFDVDDFAVFDQETATQLINDGVCELVEPIFVRTLTNYGFEFESLAQSMTRLRQDIEQVKYNQQLVEEAKKETEAQIFFRQTEQNKLMQDLAKVTTERDRITEYAQLLQKKRDDLRAELSALYHSNAELAEELASHHRRVQEDVQQALDEAGSE